MTGCLEGAADLHVHSAPDVDPRRYDDIELAREAARAGMAAVLIKNHQFSTVERARLASKVVPEVKVFGGLVLNQTVGGLNPAAVRVALELGAKQIWMPTRSAKNHSEHKGGDGSITVLDAEGRLRPEVLEILELVAASQAILGTGHLSPAEGALVAREAGKRGAGKVLVTHPEWAPTFYPVELQRELAGLGHVWFERCFVSTTHRGGHVPLDVIAEGIAASGVDRTVLSTDLGQPDTPPPAEGLRLYAERLRAAGFAAQELRRMMVVNPRELLGV